MVFPVAMEEEARAVMLRRKNLHLFVCQDLS